MDSTFMIFDVETVPDGEGLLCTNYKDASSPEEAVKLAIADALKKSDGKSDFLPLPFHVPVCVGTMVLNFKDLTAVASIISGSPKKIARTFWAVYGSVPAVLVSFNGRGFDLPLLELLALRDGLTIPSKYFDKYGPRNRFGDGHIDIQEFLNNSGAVRLFGGLDTFAKWIGREGKSDVDGSSVRQLHAEGQLHRIYDYCLGDVKDTAALFLRTRVMMGALTPEKEATLLSKF